eukprot:scaffold58_cov256-Pinguiococcus_pyrenoidosus.AAC.13
MSSARIARAHWSHLAPLKPPPRPAATGSARRRPRGRQEQAPRGCAAIAPWRWPAARPPLHSQDGQRPI